MRSMRTQGKHFCAPKNIAAFFINNAHCNQLERERRKAAAAARLAPAPRPQHNSLIFQRHLQRLIFFALACSAAAGYTPGVSYESFANHEPVLHQPAFVADCAALIGQVRLEQDSSVWHHATLRADLAPIVIGRASNIQDNACIHIDIDRGCYVGDYVTVGHGAILHACTIEDDCLIGMGAIVLDGAVIGRGSLVGAGAVVTKNMVIPPCSLVLGMPAKVVRSLGEESISNNHKHAEQYISFARRFAERKAP